LTKADDKKTDSNAGARNHMKRERNTGVIMQGTPAAKNVVNPISVSNKYRFGRNCNIDYKELEAKAAAWE
jgi:hypothetical protein